MNSQTWAQNTLASAKVKGSCSSSAIATESRLIFLALSGKPLIQRAIAVADRRVTLGLWPIRDASGAPLDYDIEAQTRAVIENVKAILEAAGSSLEKVVDITTFLVDMDRDFATYNRVYREYFQNIQPARTTVAISALPTPIAIELKVLARA